MLQQSIKVSLIAVSSEQLIYLLLTYTLPILAIPFRDTPVTLGRHNYFNKDGCGLGFGIQDLG